jgi:mono/diheme cytochrome c family protein
MVKKQLNCLSASVLIASGLMTVSVAFGADRSGEQVFHDTCYLCHTTGVSPSLTKQPLPFETLLYIVRHGSNGMPAFRPTEISDKELHNLADYLASLQPKQGKPQ